MSYTITAFCDGWISDDLEDCVVEICLRHGGKQANYALECSQDANGNATLTRVTIKLESEPHAVALATALAANGLDDVSLSDADALSVSTH
jgi:hypothetical protein